MTDYKTILFSKHDRIATITLNRPDEANGLDTQMAEELALAAAKAANDADIKAVVLTGNGRFFCAGGDIKAMEAFGDNCEAGLKHIADELHKAISIFARMDAPLIIAVNGTAAGAGFSLAATGDIVIAAESAKFVMAYTNAGLSPDGSSSYYLPRLIGMRKTQELMLTNRVLSSAEAAEWGVITRAVPSDELMAEALKQAMVFVGGAKGSFSAVKRLLLETWANNLETQMENEGVIISRIADTADGQEGIAAFIAKRKPEFQ